ncbi:MAG: 50S ribosomal protein L19 [uncultured bacterium]|uniref:50S ribosomal protein L19 n=4 Tax=Candidatus Daviesiibacteriota TaxID=1752718 RepID=A0A0G0HBP9_9BACT|nr:MAG: 50S ribosomal protein L19 [uncultured bacterium]KKQ09534.1 MAG: 50S ribosomal protein L19 [Candidatus Daviesbacteria bacterium GW2011_GWB1_36_5]KKQ15590.1 MAG: 50S ribosomal protein L19 [Candidatus Daviesbacteria bacterium GW2011_GWA1_36_8]OGE17519.1 MAG: 50S ribosomal protein L19 [Candidatus Daviesbacteria bacterium RIFCSPHIGHO2_01_FULL_36_37]OGE36613.1 MAG: 50S ribosomal protein L19 [Candidatus Daviesbacteria bacterium RIFCSPHIGHO2_12_FULL_37_16]
MLNTSFKDTQLNIGQTLRVKYNIVEGGKTRVQTFEGVLIAIRGRGENRTITVRRIGDRNVGVERIWPINSRSLVEVSVVKSPKKVRRSKLYFLRNISGKMSSYI